MYTTMDESLDWRTGEHSTKGMRTKEYIQDATRVPTRGTESKAGDNREAYKVGTRTRGNKNEWETYWVGTGSELAGTVSEQVLTKGC